METGSKSGKPARKQFRIRGICRDAAILGVTRVHLSYVLRGKRPGESLLSRYSQLKNSQAQKVKPKK
jgi:hypothetical protein